MLPPHKTLCARLFYLRSLTPLGPTQLAKLAGLGDAHVTYIERGDREHISAETALSLAEVLGCSVEWLVRGVGEPPPADTVRAAVEAARARKTGEVVIDRSDPDVVQVTPEAS
jgi:transcriptional regulator with XRE-family HTH domain